MNKRNTVRSVKQICWPLSVSRSRFLSFPLSPKDDLPQTDVLSLTVCSIFCPFKGYEWNAALGPILARVCAAYFLAERWKMLRKRSAEPLGALAGDTASVQSCRSFFPVPSLPVVSTSPRSWLGFVWQPALIAPWGSLGGREPSPWWSEHRTSAKQSIVTGARWGERNKMSQQQVFSFCCFCL